MTRLQKSKTLDKQGPFKTEANQIQLKDSTNRDTHHSWSPKTIKSKPQSKKKSHELRGQVLDTRHPQHLF